MKQDDLKEKLLKELPAESVVDESSFENDDFGALSVTYTRHGLSVRAVMSTDGTVCDCIADIDPFTLQSLDRPLPEWDFADILSILSGLDAAESTGDAYYCKAARDVHAKVTKWVDQIGG